jgi:uncharacterized protein YbjT (DUF2867 family)
MFTVAIRDAYRHDVRIPTSGARAPTRTLHAVQGLRIFYYLLGVALKARGNQQPGFKTSKSIWANYFLIAFLKSLPEHCYRCSKSLQQHIRFATFNNTKMTEPRTILVVGATGKQGGAVISALTSQPLPFPTNILALTRNPTSPSAQRLLSTHPNLTLIHGDLSSPAAIFTQLPTPPWAIFLVTDPSFGAKHPSGIPLEQRQGTTFIQSAAQHSVQHIIFSSVDRGGDAHSLTNPTPIPHFISKHEIELCLIKACTSSSSSPNSMTYTIIRPVAFMDNLTPSQFGRLFASMWASTVDPKPLQLVATRDIGRLARNALASIGGTEAEAEASVFRNAGIGLAGAELTQREADEVFWKVLGRPMPKAWWVTGKALQWGVKEVGVMFRWFREEGYGVDIERVGERYGAEVTGLEEYLRELSGFRR